MQITITVTPTDYRGGSKDIIVNSKQKIMDTLAILGEAGIVEDASVIRKIQSVRSGEYVDAACTYEEAGIVYGDIVRLVR